MLPEAQCGDITRKSEGQESLIASGIYEVWMYHEVEVWIEGHGSAKTAKLNPAGMSLYPSGRKDDAAIKVNLNELRLVVSNGKYRAQY